MTTQKPIEKRNINNPREWVVPGTNIFIIPQGVVQSSDPETSKFTIRHGCFSEDKGRLMGIVSDYIENGHDDVGGFNTFSDVVAYLEREAIFCEEIHKWASMGLTTQAAEVYVEANKNNRLYGKNGITLERAINKIEHTSLVVLESRAIAWRYAFEENLDAMKRGMTKDETHLKNSPN